MLAARASPTRNEIAAVQVCVFHRVSPNRCIPSLKLKKQRFLAQVGNGLR